MYVQVEEEIDEHVDHEEVEDVVRSGHISCGSLPSEADAQHNVDNARQTDEGEKRAASFRLWSCICCPVLVLILIVAVDGTRVRAAEYTFPRFLDEESVHTEKED